MHQKSLSAIARSGYSARGIVYLIIGGLALLAAFGGDGKTVGSKGALGTLANETAGQLVLVLIAIGLFGYAIWRAVQAFFDADDHGTDPRGLVVRGGLLISAITHLLLGLYALSLPFTLSSGSAGGSSGAISWLMRHEYGHYLVGLAGIAIAGAGFAQAWKGISGRYRKHLSMRPALLKLLAPVCAFGLTARGIVFIIVGGFVVYAAYTVDPGQAGGLADALHWLRAQKYGMALFVIAAAGLFSFGAYSLIEAFWRRVNAPGSEDSISGFP